MTEQTWFLIVVVILVVVVFSPLKEQLSNLVTGGASTDKVLVLFKADWCNYSLKFKPDWDKIRDQINTITVDADKQPNLIKEHNINSFPTLKLYVEGFKKHGMSIKYEGNRNIKDILKFYNSNSKKSCLE